MVRAWGNEASNWRDSKGQPVHRLPRVDRSFPSYACTVNLCVVLLHSIAVLWVTDLVDANVREYRFLTR